MPTVDAPGGPGFWDRVARLPGSSPVVDFQPEESAWARYITALHLRALGRALGPGRTGERVLDFGCGVGRVARWLAGRGAHVLAVDSSAGMVAAARERDLPATVEVHLLGDPKTPPLAGMDAAVAIWVLQHILDDAEFEAAVSLLCDAVRPGGAVVTIDRLCREDVDRRESDYDRLRTVAAYGDTFAARGMELVAHYPIWVDQQVLGRPGLTRLARRHDWVRPLLVPLDLAWARRQRDPFLADHLWHFRRPETPG